MIINSVGYNFVHGKDFKIQRPNGLNEYLFLIIRSGAVFGIDGKTFQISPNSMIFINKKSPHFFCANSDCFINDWVAVDFSEQELHLLTKEKIKFNTFFCTPDVTFCSELIKLMQKENMSSNTSKESNLQHLLNIILNKTADNSEYCCPGKLYYNELRKIRDKICSAPFEKYSIKNLAKEIHLSESYFLHCYKAYFGTTPIKDVIGSRIEYSKQLLSSTSFTISKIAEITGYASDTQFIKQFKKITDTTPHKYRNSLNNK